MKQFKQKVLEGKRMEPILYLLFMIWPFASFLVSFRNILNRNYHGMFLMFSFIYGYTVFFSEGDITHYEETFHEVFEYTWEDYWYLLTHLFDTDRLLFYKPNTVNSQPDIYALSMQFLISRFTDNSRWFFAIINVIYTFIFISFIKEVMKHTEWKTTFIQKVFFVYLFFIVPFYVGVTGVRFWTALFLFMLFTIRYIETGEKKWFFAALLPIGIHYTFAIPAFFLFIYNFIKKTKVVTYSLIFISLGFFILSSTSSSLGFIQEFTSLFEETSIESKTSAYTSEENLEGRGAEEAALNWYVKVGDKTHIIFFIAVYLLEFFGFFKWKENDFIEKINPFLLLFFCLALLTFNLGSIGRFLYIFYLLSIIRLFLLARLNEEDKNLRLLANISVPILVLHILITFRAGFYTVDPFLFIGNPIMLFLMDLSKVSLSEFIVGH